jgi:hypothetical protein
VALFERCVEKAQLQVKDNAEMRQLMAYLGGGDYGEGYRYARPFDLVPHLSWVQESIKELISNIKPYVERWAEKHGMPRLSEARAVTRLRYAVRPSSHYTR